MLKISIFIDCLFYFVVWIANGSNTFCKKIYTYISTFKTIFEKDSPTSLRIH